MAEITGKNDVRIYQIQKFLGLNESADGDTQLQMGEASEMRNWQVTPQYHLRVRPGYTVQRQFDGPVRGLWSGCVAGEQKNLCVADGGVWELDDDGFRRIGDIWDAPTTMFGFGGKVYFLNGQEYLVWDGEGFVDTVDGYVPLVATAMAPEGGGITVESVNRLTGKRRCRFSADGTAREYHLPEQRLLSVNRITIGGAEMEENWSVDIKTGVLTFDAPPEAGSNNVEVWYTMPNTLRALVEGMRYAEQFNGAADTRVFLYGDGSAKAIYCGITEDGQPSAEYFPDLYEMQVGSSNAPITGMIKYYDRLMSYKSDGGAYATQYEITTLADGTVIPGFRTVAINREIGNNAVGQVRLVKNVPRTIYGGNLYDWVMANYATRDERNAKLISQRVRNTLLRAEPEKTFCFDDDTKQEYYLFLNDTGGTVLVHNYQADVWYSYTNLPVVCAVRRGRELLFGFSDGRLVRFREEQPNDDGQAIDAFFASGHMAFGEDFTRKYSALTWVSVKPTDNANLEVSARSDRKGSCGDKTVSMCLSTFRNGDFSRWSFLTSRSPKIQRLKLKVKKFVYYQMILKSCYPASDATVLGVDMQVRYGAMAK